MVCKLFGVIMKKNMFKSCPCCYYKFRLPEAWCGAVVVVVVNVVDVNTVVAVASKKIMFFQFIFAVIYKTEKISLF